MFFKLAKVLSILGGCTWFLSVWLPYWMSFAVWKCWILRLNCCVNVTFALSGIISYGCKLEKWRTRSARNKSSCLVCFVGPVSISDAFDACAPLRDPQGDKLQQLGQRVRRTLALCSWIYTGAKIVAWWTATLPAITNPEKIRQDAAQATISLKSKPRRLPPH